LRKVLTLNFTEWAQRKKNYLGLHSIRTSIPS